MLKQIIFFLPFVALLLSVLSGCADTSSADNPSNNQASSLPVGTVRGVPSGSGGVQTNGTQDPLFSYQWHLQNIGQDRIPGVDRPQSGADLNLTDSSGAALVTESTNNGQGVRIAIVDSGLEIKHEDLGSRVDNGSWDFVENDNDPTSTDQQGNHGTSVAGIAAATGWNGVGGRGIAPMATLRGFNFLESQSPISFVDSHGRGDGSNTARSNDVDVFNLSYGIDFSPLAGFDTAEFTHFQCVVGGVSCNNGSALRGGKGGLFIKAVGNAFSSATAINGGSNIFNCTTSRIHEVSCQNANFDYQNTMPYMITVAALNAEDIKASYSTAGSSLWVSAYGGETGYSRTRVTIREGADIDIDVVYAPAIITTDQSACNYGYEYAALVDFGFYLSPFSDPSSSGEHHNTNCNYTSGFNGSSSATPMVSGVVALMLEANPSLTWRDIKYILAATATQIDAQKAATSVSVSNVNLEVTPAWITNGAGFNFHNWYGFGKVNAGAAVAMATAYSVDLGTFKTQTLSNNSAFALVNSNASGVTSTIGISSPTVNTVEAITVEINASLSDVAQTQFELQSSVAGTKSVLLHAHNGLNVVVNNYSFFLTTNAFYGETTSGTWTLRAIKTGNANTVTDTVHSWKMHLYGH